MTRRAVALVLAGALLLAACSTGGSDDEATPPSDQTTTTEQGAGAPTTTGPIGSADPPIADALRIEVLSSQPDRISGDDARIRVTPGPGQRADEVQVLVGDRDVTAQLTAEGDALEGVITGLIEGNSTLVARAGGEEAVQRLRTWPLTGPMISGPHLPLVGCTTEGLGLGPATDDACSAPRQVTWRYATTEGELADLPAGDALPADLATATIAGREVPLFVRVERGVINRSPYELTTVAPAPDDAQVGDAGWNQRLLLRASGPCATTYGQGGLRSPADLGSLRLGYAVLTASFVDQDAGCNDVLAAETAMMAKERAIELLGRPRHTIGVGERAGAAVLHLLVQDYPGIVNGVVATDPLPDLITTLPAVADCRLLARYGETAAGKLLSARQRAAIAGQAAPEACERWTDELEAELLPTVGCDPALPLERSYDPLARPDGVRCTYHDALRNQLGTDLSGRVWTTIDNEGLQYGLEALNDGVISFEQFLDLNREIGGLDRDGGLTADRSIAAFDGVAKAYETGRVSLAGGDQLAVPMIDIDRFDDATGTLYDRRRAFAQRDRLTRGREADAAPGFQIWTRDADDPRTSGVTAEAIAVIDRWLTALGDDAEGGELAEVLRRTRPEDAVDNCLVPGEDEPRRGVDVYEEGGACVGAFPVGGDPRTVAGGPRSGHVLKCERKAPDLADYELDLTAAQLDQLIEVFPTGVCDWFVPSVGQTTPAAPDRSYEDATSPLQSL